MKILFYTLLIILLMSFATSCVNQQMLLKSGDVTEFETEPTEDKWVHFFLWGLAPDVQEFNPVDYCATNGKKLVATESRASFLNGLVTILTYGLYTPRRLKIWCE